MTPSLTPLLEALATPGASVTADQAIEQLLGQMDPSDPRVRLVANALARQRAAPAPEFEPEPPDDSSLRELEALVREAQARAEHAARAEEKLRGIVRGVMDELQILRERNNLLAAALGACYVCWGEDAECAVCGGAGQPGSVRPEPHLFARLVAPAVHASGARRPPVRRRRQPVVPTDPPTPQPENRA